MRGLLITLYASGGLTVIIAALGAMIRSDEPKPRARWIAEI